MQNKEKEKEREEEKKRKLPKIANRIATLLYFTFERVPVVFYHTTLD